MPRSGRRGRSLPHQAGGSPSPPAEASDAQPSTEDAPEASSQPPRAAQDLLEQIELAASKGDMQLVQELTQISTSYSGPIPWPAVLKGYEGIVPGSADRIMGRAESQTRHRHQLEADRARAEVEQVARRQHYALVIGLASYSELWHARGWGIRGSAASWRCRLRSHRGASRDHSVPARAAQSCRP